MAAPKPSARALREKITLILSQVDRKAKIYNDVTIAEVARSLGVEVPPRQPVLVNPQVQLLRVLYTSLPGRHQGQFVTILLKGISDRTAQVIVHTLIDLGHFKALERFLAGNVPPTVRTLTWMALHDALVHEPQRFGERDLALIEKMQKADRKRFPPTRVQREDSIIIPRNYSV
jgi:hypothetical protein